MSDNSSAPRAGPAWLLVVLGALLSRLESDLGNLLLLLNTSYSLSAPLAIVYCACKSKQP